MRQVQEERSPGTRRAAPVRSVWRGGAGRVLRRVLAQGVALCAAFAEAEANGVTPTRARAPRRAR